MINPDQLTSIKADHGFLAGAFKKMPETWARPVASNYKKQLKNHGRQAANLRVLDLVEAVEGFRFGVAGDDDELRAFSKARAAECFRTSARYLDKDLALAAMIEIAQRYGIQAPAGRNVTKTGQRMRLLDENWWRRNVRKTAARNVEAAAIQVGLVSRVAGLYASDEAVKRRRGQRARNAQILAGIVAVNDAGQEYSLKDLSDLGTSNPEKRRMELMTRIAGFDAVAVKHNHAAEFYTITAPSKYHARHHIHGRENPNYNGATPAETQAYLCKVWARIRSKLHRDGVDFYGFRVAEPHHDATPHWHLLLFTPAENVAYMRAVIKSYALAEDGDEPGANIHRFKAEKIDRKKGSAAGYIAKYISKNIDGMNNDGASIGDDYEAIHGEDDATQTARRVDAWASTWGIRQFQQIGGQSVTTYREMRRADPAAIENEKLKAIVSAADAGAWDQYTELNGGVMRNVYEYPRFSKKQNRPLCNGRKALKIRHVTLDKIGALDLDTGEIRLNQYTEPAADKTAGFKGFGLAVNTHLMTWEFKRGGAAVPPRSSVNNCTQVTVRPLQIGAAWVEIRGKGKRNKKLYREKTVFSRNRKASEERPAFCLVDLSPDYQQKAFLQGEDLKAWEQQQQQKTAPPAPKEKPTPNVWPPCLAVLKSSSLRSRRSDPPAL